MHTDQLRYLIEVSKCTSITQASQKLHLTPATLSISLNKLEKELNITLFERTSKGIILTDDGYGLIKIAETFLEKVNALTNKSTSDATPTISGSIDLMTTYGAIEHFLAKILQDFFKDYPDISVNFDEFYADNFTDKFLSSAYEVGFFTNYRYALNTDSLQYHHLFDCQLTALFSKDDPAAKFKSVPIHYLERYGYIIFGKSTFVTNNPSFKLLHDLQFTPAKIYYSQNTHLTQELLRTQKCTTFSYLHDHFPNTMLPNDDIVAVPIKNSPIIPFGYLTHTDRELSIPASYFLNHLHHYINHRLKQ